jgi:D-amino-acid dehydrogenase
MQPSDTQTAASPKHAVVVGGGIVGAMSAYYLARAGRRVTIIERGKYGAGCSDGNCGLLGYSHALPLCAPGGLQKAFSSFLHRDSPLKIKPGLNPRLYLWLLAFGRNCNEAAMLRSAKARLPLLASSAERYDELFTSGELEGEYQKVGALFVHRDPAEMKHYAETDLLLRETFNLPASFLSGSELQDFEPTLRPDLPGAFFYEMDCHVRPDVLLASLRKALERLGVEIREGVAMTGFSGKTHGRVVAVQTDAGDIPADDVVIATGAYSPKLEKHLGVRLPIQPGKGYSITLNRPAAAPKVPLHFRESKVVATPFHSGYRLGSMMEFVGYNTSTPESRLALLRKAEAAYMTEPADEPTLEKWFGFRPMTSDGVPRIGRVPVAENVVLAAGHNMLGLSMAPATGRLVTELITGKTPHIDSEPYRVK